MRNRMIDLFFYWMNERYTIYLKKEAGYPWPWTDDKILQEYKFTNPFRELDRVTVWIDQNWRKPYAKHPNLWFAMCVARQINRPETLAALEQCVFAKRGWDYKKATRTMDDLQASGVAVYTGAYMIRAESDPTKAWYSWSKNRYMCEIVLKRVWDARKEFVEVIKIKSLEQTTKWLCRFHGWGGFMSYEAVTDMRHTKILNKATDIYTWANPGPGAVRGLNRIHNRPLKNRIAMADAVTEMKELLQLANEAMAKGITGPLGEIAVRYKPGLEMRDIEHSLCEFDKYMRVQNGEGKPRSKYRRPE